MSTETYYAVVRAPDDGKGTLRPNENELRSRMADAVSVYAQRLRRDHVAITNLFRSDQEAWDAAVRASRSHEAPHGVVRVSVTVHVEHLSTPEIKTTITKKGGVGPIEISGPPWD